MTRLLRAELVKFFSTRMWWGLLISVMATAALFSGVYAGVAGHYGMPGLDNPGMVRIVYTAGMSTAYLFTLSMGIVSITGEFRHQTMTATALAIPRRYRIVTAKLGAVTVIGLFYGAVSVLSGVLVASVITLIRGYGVPLLDQGVPRALALAVLAVTLWGILGLGVGTLIRNQIVALMVAVGIAWLGESLVSFLLIMADLEVVAKFLPGMATTALVQPPDLGGAEAAAMSYLPWWGGALVLLGYALISSAIGSVLTLRRDIG